MSKSYWRIRKGFLEKVITTLIFIEWVGDSFINKVRGNSSMGSITNKADDVNMQKFLYNLPGGYVDVKAGWGEFLENKAIKGDWDQNMKSI